MTTRTPTRTAGAALAALLLAAQPVSATGESAAWKPPPATGGTAPAELAQSDEPDAEAEASETPLEDRGYALGDVKLGNADAPLTVIEYASFTCGHCATFHADAYPLLKERYIDSGKVAYVIRDVYFDQYGLLAGRIARCTGDSGFHLLADAILDSQNDWIRADDPGVALYRVALREGVPPTRLRDCLEDREYALALVESFKDNADRDEIESTPTFLIGDQRLVGARSFEEIAAIIDEELDG